MTILPHDLLELKAAREEQDYAARIAAMKPGDLPLRLPLGSDLRDKYLAMLYEHAPTLIEAAEELIRVQQRAANLLCERDTLIANLNAAMKRISDLERHNAALVAGVGEVAALKAQVDGLDGVRVMNEGSLLKMEQESAMAALPPPPSGSAVERARAIVTGWFKNPHVDTGVSELIDAIAAALDSEGAELREAVRVLAREAGEGRECFCLHNQWCGNRKKAPGNQIINTYQRTWGETNANPVASVALKAAERKDEQQT